MTNRTIVGIFAVLAVANVAQGFQQGLPVATDGAVVSGPIVEGSPGVVTEGSTGIFGGESSGGSFLGDLDLNPLGNYPSRWKIRADYVYFYLQGTNLPPMVTTSPTGTPQATAGVVGAPGTTILASGREDKGYPDGYRFRILYWFDNFESDGIEFSFTGFNGSSKFFNGSSPGDPILARPFVDTATGLQQAQLVAFPGLVAGSLDMDRMQEFYAIDLMGRQNFSYTQSSRADFLFGFRYLRLGDYFSVKEKLIPAGAGTPFADGTVIGVNDNYDCENNFFLAQIGIESTVRRGPFALEFFGRLGMGANYQYFRVQGTTNVFVPDTDPAGVPGGLLANSGNQGSYAQQLKFAVVPELGINLRVQILPSLSVHTGYSFTYLFPTVRPGDVIEKAGINPALLNPTDSFGPRRSVESFGSSNTWLMGISGGFEFRY